MSSALLDSVAFDKPALTQDGYGGQISGWSKDEYACRAQFIYSRGSEAIDSARLSGRAIYKVKIRQSDAARLITTEWRMRDARRGTEFNIREIDAVTDRQWIYLVVESGVAP